MTLRQKQSAFLRYVARLLEQVKELGLEATFGETWRSPEEARRRGFPKSLHVERLAIDLNLFRGGRYLTSTEAHRPLGEWWERQHDLARWGGRFGDGNHYSFTHGGRK